VILSRDATWAAKLQSAVFPGVQGSIHTQVIAAKAVCLGEALKPEFRDYGRKVQANARTLARVLTERQIAVVSGGTDTHIVLLDLRARGLKGQAVQDALYAAGITSNKNPVPFDVARPADWSGLRLGSAAATTRGLDEADFAELGAVIADVIDDAARGSDQNDTARRRVAALADRHPIYR
jgi:glycine hydroxymethyltransferase